MRALAVILLAIAGLVVGAAAVWHLKYPSYSLRYRLAVQIVADGAVHTGSSVIKVTWTSGPVLGDGGTFHPSLQGQAVFVDLGLHGALVAALYNGESYGPAPDGAFGAVWVGARAFGNQSTNAELPELPALHGVRHLAPDNMPRLIWFPDPRDPTTAQKILAADLSKTIGQTVRFADATVEITRDPIVVDIDKKLRWFEELAARQKAHGVVSKPNEFHLNHMMFVSD